MPQGLRGVGLSGLARSQQQRDAFAAAGSHAQEHRLARLISQADTFRRSLEHFADVHRENIKGNAQLRAMFMRMCLQMGVDPLQSKKAFWGELLGLGDFYYELAIQIIDMCMAKRSDTGGLLDLNVLHSYILEKRSRTSGPATTSHLLQQQITIDDLTRSIRKLKVLNSGFDIVNIGGKKFVRSIPRELATDENEILEMASGRGYVTRSQVIDGKSNWNAARFDECLKVLLREGLAMIDECEYVGTSRQRNNDHSITDSTPPQKIETLYWFPCLGMDAHDLHL